MATRHVRLVFPHQLFVEQLDADEGTYFVLVEDDLFFRQYRFHAQKLVLHRASMRRFAARLEEEGFRVGTVETDGRRNSSTGLSQVLAELEPMRVSCYDVVDDWLHQNTVATLADLDLEIAEEDWLESPNFVTSRAQVEDWFGGDRTHRMAAFYEWQRKRLDILVEGSGEDASPVGGQWSFDEDNRKKLPKGYDVPRVDRPGDAEVSDEGDSERHEAVVEAISWVKDAFGDNPGDPDLFAWPTSHDEAEAGLEQFLAERFTDFGPYEDALHSSHRFMFHSLLTPGLNIGLLDPEQVVRRAVEVGSDDSGDGPGVPLNSLEGFIRQVIGWREYMRATYVTRGRAMRTSNHLGHTAELGEGWWTARTGLAPVDHVIGNVLESGYAHHIERLMVLGNATCLLRADPDAVYEWFMEMFIDAYDWVMVPNVYAMSQFAAGTMITTKPYVSGSNYLRKMSDYGSGLEESDVERNDGRDADWQADWDGLYWTFVRDHREVFEKNGRSYFVTANYDKMDASTKSEHTKRAGAYLP
ncbi:cryptochrome/photolyase family protein [Nocardioidaceae bacterium]|nr:cryptochrome/photolyase family protein [Nocardioidaceae bacterium]